MLALEEGLFLPSNHKDSKALTQQVCALYLCSVTETT